MDDQTGLNEQDFRLSAAIRKTVASYLQILEAGGIGRRRKLELPGAKVAFMLMTDKQKV